MVPLTATQAQPLAAVRAAWPATDIVLIGALALGHHIPMTYRATDDLDLTLAVPFDGFPGPLTDLPGWKRHPKMENRFFTADGQMVDVLPVCDDLIAKGHIHWRDGHRSGRIPDPIGFVLPGYRTHLRSEARQSPSSLHMTAPAQSSSRIGEQEPLWAVQRPSSLHFAEPRQCSSELGAHRLNPPMSQRPDCLHAVDAAQLAFVTAHSFPPEAATQRPLELQYGVAAHDASVAMQAPCSVVHKPLSAHSLELAQGSAQTPSAHSSGDTHIVRSLHTSPTV